MVKKKESKAICKKCWGKGYSTRLIGNTITSPDFTGEKFKVIRKSGIRIFLCDCERGQDIKKYFTIKRKYKS